MPEVRSNMPEFNRWFSDNAEHLRYEYEDLNSDSIVIDLGVYHGIFAKLIAEKYDCHVYGFEPIKEFFDLSSTKLSEFKKIKLFNYGIGDSNRVDQISLDMDGSSIYKKNKKLIEIQIRSFESVIEEFGFKKIGLLKINTEGCEYEILDHILSKNLVKIFDNIQIQFHDFVPNASQRRSQILSELKKTHKATYSYEFVWENYKIV